MTVKRLFSTFDLNITELLVVKRVLQVHTELLVALVFVGLEILGTLLGILGAGHQSLCSDDGDVADDGEAVVGQPLGWRAAPLQTGRVNKLPEAPAVRLGFELCEVGLDSVLFVLARVQDGELVPGLHLCVRLTNQNTALDLIDQSESANALT